MSGAVEFRRMMPADVPAGLALCRASGWNQTAADWDCLLAMGRDGCRVALVDGAVVGTATAINYENRFGWIGMVLVAEKVRGRGIGTALLEEAAGRLGAVPARLDATPKGHALYLRLGFLDERRLARLTRAPGPCGMGAPADGVRPMRREDMDAVAGLDREVFGADRRPLLAWARDAAPELAWVCERGTSLAGYSLGRAGHEFRQIGPVVTDDIEVGRRLVEACCAQAGDAPMAIDVLASPRGWHEGLAVLGFREQRPFVRMCRGTNLHPGRPDRQLAIFGPEWG